MWDININEMKLWFKGTTRKRRKYMEKQNLDVVYVGVFFDACEVEAWQKAFDDEGLDRNIEYPHVTLKGYLIFRVGFSTLFFYTHFSI